MAEDQVRSHGCPSALGRGPSGVYQRPHHWESCPQSPRHLLCVSCLHKRHAGNPAAGHCQEVQDTDSKAMGSGDRENRGGPFILSTCLTRIGGERIAKSSCDVIPTFCTKGRDSSVPYKMHPVPLDKRRLSKWAGLPITHRAESHHF